MTRRQTGGRRVSLLVDARYLSAPGLGRYTREITARLLRDERFGPITLAGDRRVVTAWLDRQGLPAGTAFVVHVPPAPFHPASQVGWVRLCARQVIRAQVAFFPHYDVPLLWRPPASVVAVHDLTHYRVPDAFPAWKRLLGGRLLRAAVDRADRIITGSSAAASDLAATLRGVAGRTSVIPHGVDPFFSPSPEPPPSAVRPLQPYLLCVGEVKPHKNHRVAVRALGMLRREGRDRLRLVIAGGERASDDGLGRVIQDEGVASAVVRLGRISDPELRDLYRHCEALLFPSLYEGFGLPPLEAMACGAPVIASDRASVPEVVGDAGIVVDPEDPAAWANAVKLLMTDGRLRTRVVARGQERAAMFSWNAAAERTAAVLLETAEERDGRRTPRAGVSL